MSEVQFPIYLDSHATTPVDPRVFEEMKPYFTEKFGNASSLDHPYGYDASVAVQESREIIAKAIGANMDEIIFTSGATESDNLALIGVMKRNKDKGNHLITCVTEHKAILDTARHLEELGNKVTYLPVDKFGSIDLEELKNSITDETVLISIMFANNEIGTIANVSEIGKIAHEKNILFHTDAAQAVGHIPIDVKKMNIDLMSFSSHKIYGPKGIGALYVRSLMPRVKIDSIVYGGGQERNLRSGTLNVPGIVGFAKAIEISQIEMNKENIKFKKWTDYMLKKLSEASAKLNGHPTNRLVHNLNIRFDGIESKAIINSVSKKIAISAGSACTTQMVEPSHVLLALGLEEEETHSAIRIGCGRFNTDDKEINGCVYHDLVNYDIPLGLSHEEFLNRLKKKFFEHPFIQRIEQFLVPDGYFGSIKQWVQSNCTDVPVPSRRELTGNIQVLFEWFEKLGDGKYVRDRPNYSERLTKIS